LFWSKFDKISSPKGCWLWTGQVNPETCYGDVPNTLADGKRTTAHRHAWRLTHGDPGELSVLHRCDTRLCGRPDHLFLGTARDNWEDSVAKGRQTFIVPGAANGAAKLTDDEVRAIRRSASKTAELVRQFGVDFSTICRVIRRDTWRHVAVEDDTADDTAILLASVHTAKESNQHGN
jgi:hypothetical protein